MQSVTRCFLCPGDKMPKIQDDQEIREHRYETVWRLVNIDGYNYTAAWIIAYPKTKAKKNARCILAKRACDAFEKTHAHDLQKLLEVSGLGLPRVMKEIQKGLTQKKVELHKGKIIKKRNGDPLLFDDNFIQQRSRELLVRIHGLEKQKIEINNKLDEAIDAFRNIK